MLSEKKERKRKMCSKKWNLKRNISCDVHLLNGLLETDVPWDDVIVLWAGKMRKLWDSVSELRSYVCERRLEKTVPRCALYPVKTGQFTQFFYQAWRLLLLLILLSFDRLAAFHLQLLQAIIFPCCMTSHTKMSQFNWQCIGRLWKTVSRSGVPTSLSPPHGIFVAPFCL